jgi:DNA-3-methyladenine glycosylase
MFGRPGTAYVYLVYGLHYCLNIVTERENFGSAVLIRALDNLNNFQEAENLDEKNFTKFGKSDKFLRKDLKVFCKTNGPGKLCQAMAIDMNCNGLDMTVGEDRNTNLINKNNNLWVEQSVSIPPEDVVQTTRIGIRHAKDYLRRFYVRGNKFTS